MNDLDLPNFPILDLGPATRACLSQKLYSFKDVTHFIRLLPYGRIPNTNDLTLVVQEKCGTCSSKHAFLAKVADECEQPIKLMLGIYEMDGENTLGVGSILGKANLKYLPEAHCYVSYKGLRFDFTRPENPIVLKLKLLEEQEILPHQSGSFKTEIHKSFLRKWVASERLNYNFEQIWEIREQCIASLRS